MDVGTPFPALLWLVFLAHNMCAQRGTITIEGSTLSINCSHTRTLHDLTKGPISSSVRMDQLIELGMTDGLIQMRT
ncbi:uncharacterized protein EDB91DRAFT_1099303 [Suillus paluster]|uniref:uncharacterized protein n=1 Tax=Suillus paluster TaxID=48578 RepID=UPI001B87F260|nr:uncharacterized protein EDB91DRAFT_1099303 [Suillus paluster]KAG1753684.1 hypothetical protein EDB91DRAFT_1099303 [Suillus paluster]